jgi:DNA-binding CsgD family transcriptional regulator
MKAANFLSLAYEKAGDFKQSLENQRLYKQLYDSINSTEQIELAAKLELQYLFDKQQKENELLQQIELAKKQRKALIFMIISGVLLSSFVVLMLLNRNQKIKIKRNKLLQDSLILESKNLVLEKQNLELEKSNLTQELDFRNKELATHVMYLLKKNEFISSISEKLLNLKSLLNNDDKKWVQDIVREMKSNVDNTVWGEFEMRFQQVHDDFYARLKEHHPDLSPNEKKICAFLRLNMTTKDISSITFQSVKSIQVARTRLRKKMGMTRDENLISFLQEL